MINLNTTTAPTASALTGTPESAPAGDFLAVLAALVTDVTTQASPEGSGLLLPGSPLLDAAPLDAEIVAELDAMLEDGLVETEGAEGEAELGIPWPTVQALAALLAQPTAPADAPAIPGTDTATASVDGADVAPAAPAGALSADVVDVSADTDAAVPVEGDAESEAPPTTGTATGATTTTGATATTEIAAAAAGADPARPAGSAPSEGADAASSAGSTTAAPRSGDEAALLGGPVTDGTAVDDDAAAPTGTTATEASRRTTGAETPNGRVAATESVEEANPSSTDLRAGTVRDRGPMTSTAAGVARVLDALDRLELAPPPRQVTLEFGDMRVRVAMEDGGVRMQLLGEQRDGGREFLRAAEDALRERGFDLTGGERDDTRGEQAGQQRPDLAPPRPERVVGRSGRSAATTSIGARPGVHL